MNIGEADVGFKVGQIQSYKPKWLHKNPVYTS